MNNGWDLRLKSYKPAARQVENDLLGLRDLLGQTKPLELQSLVMDHQASGKVDKDCKFENLDSQLEEFGGEVTKEQTLGTEATTTTTSTSTSSIPQCNCDQQYDMEWPFNILKAIKKSKNNEKTPSRRESFPAHPKGP